jgi:Ca-activated chloride channel family protein
MRRLFTILISGLILTAGADPQTETKPQSEPSPPASPWIHNARSRTESGIAAQEQGEAAIAGEALGSALELAPADPLVQYNAGTASLLDAGSEAVALLQAAAEAAPGSLRPSAYYNLGNALLAGQDPAAAIDAYKQSLRLSPTSFDAKHNLELAQKLLEQQQEQEQQEQEQEQDEEQEQEEQEQQQQDQEQNQEEQEQSQDQQQQPSDSPLPDFEDQPDMTAEQAAAILEAVENLEREQRRKQALEQMKKATKERDW